MMGWGRQAAWLQPAGGGDHDSFEVLIISLLPPLLTLYIVRFFSNSDKTINNLCHPCINECSHVIFNFVARLLFSIVFLCFVL